MAEKDILVETWKPWIDVCDTKFREHYGISLRSDEKHRIAEALEKTLTKATESNDLGALRTKLPATAAVELIDLFFDRILSGRTVVEQPI